MTATRLGRRTVLLAAPLFAVGLSGCLGPRPEPTPSPSPDLLQLLRQGGATLYLRHPETDRGGVDQPDWPRAEQRLLSQGGEVQAMWWGRAFRHHGLTASEVLTSPSLRCQDAAEIAFGGWEVEPALTANLAVPEGAEERATQIRRLIATAPPDGSLRVLIGHASNISAITGTTITEGAGILIPPEPQAATAVVTIVDWENWAA
ncbi:histidine phosphatase family protein [Ammonicoccus fulvus]|uniref:Histidine phosphatase family protein n=1 Tax=Ammonicoccus fulvus TaxID=3138240 RepID=A0ABZ3FR59_9ACTN